MGIYDFTFLLKVEGLLVGLHLCLSELTVVILAIVREKRFWIRVTDESISAPGHSCTLVPSGKRLVYTIQHFNSISMMNENLINRAIISHIILTRVLLPNRLSGLIGFKAVFAQHFSKTPGLLTLGRHMQLFH